MIYLLYDILIILIPLDAKIRIQNNHFLTCQHKINDIMVMGWLSG